ncbi:E3 ubiquitin-protein ligase NEURL3 [Sander vitreus]
MTNEPRNRREHIFSQDMKESSFCFCKMVNGNSVVGAAASHRCSLSCLGPLTFHPWAVGDKVRLSRRCCLAERTDGTFKNGLVFSSRPVKIQEKLRLRVEQDLHNWHGALRVGFTSVPPTARSLPLPVMAIPDLTDIPGHWAVPVNESLCKAGSELQFWVSHGGSVYVSSSNTRAHKLLTGVDLSRPLWAMIDVYGQTGSIFLLGSEKRELLYTRRSCPAPEPPVTSPDLGNRYSLSRVSSLCGNSDECISPLEGPAGGGCVSDCVVCMEKQARITLPCGHRCLCSACVSRVLEDFGTCPLCRHQISAPSEVMSLTPGRNHQKTSYQ